MEEYDRWDRIGNAFDRSARAIAWATIVGLTAILIWFALGGRHTTTRYAVQYGVDRSQVTIERRPIDCEFLSSPIGRKDCHYAKVVEITLYRSGRQNISLGPPR